MLVNRLHLLTSFSEAVETYAEIFKEKDLADRESKHYNLSPEDVDQVHELLLAYVSLPIYTKMLTKTTLGAERHMWFIRNDGVDWSQVPQLPARVVGNIFKFVLTLPDLRPTNAQPSVEARFGAVRAVRSVCKAWHHVFHSDPQIWNNTVLSFNISLLPYNLVQSSLATHLKGLTSLALIGSEYDMKLKWSVDELLRLIQTLPRLTPNLTKICLAPITSMAPYAEITAETIASLTKLRSLKFQTTTPVISSTFFSLGDVYPDLLLHLTSLKTGGVSGTWLKNFVAPTNLQTFQSACEPYFNTFFETAGISLQSLRKVYLNETIRVSAWMIFQKQCGPHLLELGLGPETCSNWREMMHGLDVKVKAEFENFTALESLELGQKQRGVVSYRSCEWHFRVLKQLSQHSKKLKKLFVGAMVFTTDYLTDPSALELEDFPHLHTLILETHRDHDVPVIETFFKTLVSQAKHFPALRVLATDLPAKYAMPLVTPFPIAWPMLEYFGFKPGHQPEIFEFTKEFIRQGLDKLRDNFYILNFAQISNKNFNTATAWRNAHLSKVIIQRSPKVIERI